MISMNRLANSTNPYQGAYKKVLCLCSAGLLRSPTAALALSQAPFNFNTRAAGVTEEYALVPVDDVLLSWADEIVVMEPWMAGHVGDHLDKTVILNVKDTYAYRDPALIAEIVKQYKESQELCVEGGADECGHPTVS